jgi:hypothetical protein
VSALSVGRASASVLFVKLDHINRMAIKAKASAVSASDAMARC